MISTDRLSCLRRRASRKRYWTHERIEEAVARFCRQHGHWPRTPDWKRKDGELTLPSVDTVINRYGSVKHLRRIVAERIGVGEIPSPGRWPKGRILEAAHRFFRRHGRVPTVLDLRRKEVRSSEKVPVYTVVWREFGGMPGLRRAMLEAGIFSAIESAPAVSRNERIRRLRAAGLSLEEIGSRFGISRERVRQICRTAS